VELSGSPTSKQAAAELVRLAKEQGLSLTGPDGLLKQLTKTVIESALQEEITEHLGYEKHDPAGAGTGNIRNGSRGKTVLTEASGEVETDVARDRAGTFEPVIVKKRQRRLEGVDEIVLSLYAKGLTTGEISAHFAEIYGASVSKETISRITDRVLEEMADWATRPLDARQFLVIVANQLEIRWWRHRAMTCRGERSSRHSRGRSLSSSVTSRSRLSVTRPRSLLLGKYCRSRPLVFSLVPRCQGEWASAK
jgi:transposase-like protein